MKKLIVANWKMHGSRPMATDLVRAVAEQADTCAGRVEVVLCPPAIFIHEISELLSRSVVALGGQDCHAEAEGAYTGDISAAMLKEAGCAYVIVGHSERRAAHHEQSGAIRAKAQQAIGQGLVPIICVGEPREIRESGQAVAYVTAQTGASIPSSGDFVLAYEPVWAIGTGLTPTSEDICDMHAQLKQLVPSTRVLYGGSVNAANASGILALPSVDGALVGGASLKAEAFGNIIRAAE